MVIRTSVTLGTRETPHFVTQAFFDAMQLVCATNSFDFMFQPSTIRYFVPAHGVIERTFPVPFQEYYIDLNDACPTPICTRRNVLDKTVFKMKMPSRAFDRMEIVTEHTEHQYFLMLPNCAYYHTEVLTERVVYYLMYEQYTFCVNFRRVHVDPHSNLTHVWFNGKPQFQIEITCQEDFRANPRYLKRALLAILPRAFKWDMPSGTASSTS
jgi:hypothetical protein